MKCPSFVSVFVEGCQCKWIPTISLVVPPPWSRRIHWPITFTKTRVDTALTLGPPNHKYLILLIQTVVISWQHVFSYLVSLILVDTVTVLNQCRNHKSFANKISGNPYCISLKSEIFCKIFFTHIFFCQKNNPC